MPETSVTAILCSVEKKLSDLLSLQADSMPLRWKRWLAMYYPDARIRKVFWQKTHVEMGEGTFANPGMIVVDDYTSGECLLSIGKRVSIAPSVIFVAYSVPNNSPQMQEHPTVKHRLGQRRKIVIEDDVWIGAHVTILPGLRVGRGAIIGAGAVVNRDVAPFTIVAGVPARVLRKLDPLLEENAPEQHDGNARALPEPAADAQ